MRRGLGDLSPTEVAREIVENVIESSRFWAVWPDLEVYDDLGLEMALSRSAFSLNIVLRTRLSPNDAGPAIDEAIARAANRGVPLSWWVMPDSTPPNLVALLKDRGFVHDSAKVGMAANLEDMNDAPLPPGVTIEEVGDTDGMRAWCQVAARGFGHPDAVVEPDVRRRSTSLRHGSPWRHFLAKLDGEPAGTASMFLGAGVAGIYSVATLPEFRRLGLATATTMLPLAQARSLGYRIGTLYASELGAKVYPALGFRPYCDLHLYQWRG